MEAVRVPLTRGMVALVDADAWESDRTCHRFDGSMSITVRPSAIRWSAQVNRHFYYAVAKIRNDGRQFAAVTLHRLLSQCPAGMVVDHANGDTMDNRLANLRCCTIRENTRNIQANPRSKAGFFGVTFNKSRRNPYHASIGHRVGDKFTRVHIGNYETAEAAALAYDQRARELFGAFARLNFAEAAQ